MPPSLQDTLKLLLEYKLGYIDTLTNICTIWWVSAVVFCLTIVATVWKYKDDVKIVPAMNWLCFIIFCFFFSIVAFGFWVIYIGFRLQNDIQNLINQINVITNNASVAYTERITEIIALQGGMVLATSSFIFVTITWIGIWRELRRMRREYYKADKIRILKSLLDKPI